MHYVFIIPSSAERCSNYFHFLSIERFLQSVPLFLYVMPSMLLNNDRVKPFEDKHIIKNRHGVTIDRHTGTDSHRNIFTRQLCLGRHRFKYIQ